MKIVSVAMVVSIGMPGGLWLSRDAAAQRPLVSDPPTVKQSADTAPAQPSQPQTVRPPATAGAPSPGQPAAPNAKAGGRPSGGNWLFDPSLYTNDPKTGQRVNQYQKDPRVTRVPNDKYYTLNGPRPFGPRYYELYNGPLYRYPLTGPYPLSYRFPYHSLRIPLY